MHASKNKKKAYIDAGEMRVRIVVYNDKYGDCMEKTKGMVKFIAGDA